MSLTDITVRGLKPPSNGQKFYPDAALSGFGVRVSQGGTKTFVLVYGPRRERVTIGRYPVISLAEARTEAKRRLAEITLGRSRPKTITFEDARDKFLAASEAKNRARTVKDYRRLCGALRAKQAVASRERALTEAELGRVYRLARSQPYPFGPLVCLLLLTGQRRGEIGALRWSWIDKRQKTITFPAEITKNRRQHVLPYGDQVAQILESLPELDDLLFPASRAHVRGKLTSIFNGWPQAKAAFDKKLGGVAPYTLHDLRRTFSSHLAALGTPIHVTEKLLNHVSGTLSGVAGVYNRYSYAAEMRAAIEAYDSHVTRLAATSD